MSRRESLRLERHDGRPDGWMSGLTLVMLAVLGTTASAAPLPVVAGDLLTEAMVRRLPGSGALVHVTSSGTDDVIWRDAPTLEEHMDDLCHKSAKLCDRPRPPERDHVHVALRVWTDPAVYDELHKQRPDVDELRQFGKMFSSRSRGIISIVFEQRGVVGLLECNIAQCPTVSAAAVLARDIRVRIPR